MTNHFPSTRLRRNRKDNWSRRLVAESKLTTDDLIMPLFIIEGSSKKIEVESMPGTFRYTLDELVRVVEDVHKLSVPLVALFPCLENNLKTHDGSEALNQHGLIPRAIKKIKNAVPEIGIMTDIALDPYTTHGQDGLIDKSGYV